MVLINHVQLLLVELKYNNNNNTNYYYPNHNKTF